jgi:predicted dehydrogenase
MKTINMGFIGAGGIAQTMAKTICKIDCVKAWAVAARDGDRAKNFAQEFGFERSYGSYEEMLDDPQVELVYIATPHSHHFDHAKLCLEKGKHVLCEKAFTVNATQAEILIKLSKEKDLFLSEAIWTRYLPASDLIKSLLHRGIIGKVSLVNASFCVPNSTKERISNPALAGGALLDLGVYPLNFALMALGTDIEQISSSVVKLETGVDAQNSITLKYRDGALAILQSSCIVRGDNKGIISGSKGTIVTDHVVNPERISIFGNDGEEKTVFQRPPHITGYEFEVEAAVQAILKGKRECAEMPHSETLQVMQIMDNLRSEWGIKYPFE